MANWISSKLKAAESMLQQLDQQAAESLGKNEKPRSEETQLDPPSKTGGVVSLKDQLKKKTPENNYNGKFHNDSDVSFSILHSTNPVVTPPPLKKHITADVKPKASLSDTDWTQLLSAPSSAASRSNGAPIRVLKKDGRKPGNSGSALSVFQGKRTQKSNNNLKSTKSPDLVTGKRSNGRPSDSEESTSSGTASSIDMLIDAKRSEGVELDSKGSGLNTLMKLENKVDEVNVQPSEHRNLAASHSLDRNHSLEKIFLSTVEGVSDMKSGFTDSRDKMRGIAKGKLESSSILKGPVSDDIKRGSSWGDGNSISDSDSGSTSDSESEREREERRRRREKMLAERAAAKAVEAIKERENMVARLEGEKQSLEKILEERARQQVQEASELQTTTMEMMEAVELEKQKHNNTRMEVLQRLAKLETANADLAKSLATAQKKLEIETNQVAELRQQIDLKEGAHEELKRRISSFCDSGTYRNQLVASKGIEFEVEILEAEYSFVTEKIGQLQDKAKQIESTIEMTRKEVEEPTEVEMELKRRLGQLTDHLIQKQAQVEVLSSEKATLFFRIEAVSKILEESKANMMDASSGDLESGGAWELSNTKLRPLLEDKILSGRKQLGSLVRQLDAIFISGAVFLRRNPAAKVWSVVYLVCLHLWVIYILFSQSRPERMASSGAVISLENINNTGAV